MAKAIDFITSTSITNDDYLVMAEKATGNTRKISKSNLAPIINDLITGGIDKSLSAEQGKIAKGLIDTNTNDITTLKGQVNQTALTNIEIGSSPITSLTGLLDGFVDSLIFKGKTQYKTGSTYTDTYASGVTLESAGQSEGKLTMTSLKPDNTVGDTINITLATPLRGFTIGSTKYNDILNVESNTITRNMGKKILIGASTETWTLGNPTLQTNTLQFIYQIGDCKTGLLSTAINLMNDKFVMDTSTNNIANDTESIAIDENGQLLVRILKTKLATQDVAGFKLWLASVNITVIYPLLNSITETVSDGGTLQTFADGYLQLNNVIVPIVNFNYPVKLASIVDEHTKIIDKTVDKIGVLSADLSEKAKDTDNTRTTTSKTVTGAINELNANKLDKQYGYKHANNYIIGMEYLNYYHTKLRNHAKTTLVFGGDSTTYGTSIVDVNYKINALAKDFIENNGGNICTSINAGHENKNTADWVNTYLAQDLAQNPDLYIIRPGVNDGTFPLDTRLNTFLTNLRTGLTRIRASKNADQLSIILMSPSSTNDDTNHRNATWYDEIYPYLVDIAREFQCCFVDTYHYFYDSTNIAWGDLIMGDTTTHIHPLETANMNFITLLSDCLVPTYIRTRKQPMTFTFANNWGMESGYELNGYKVGNRVSISTVITAGTSSAQTVIGYIPEGFRPKKNVITTILSHDASMNMVMGMLFIQSTGAVTIINNIWNIQAIFSFEYTI